MNKNKVSSLADMASCVPFVFAKGIIGVYCPLGKTKYAQTVICFSECCEANGFVITMEPLGFVLTKQVGDLLMRVE